MIGNNFIIRKKFSYLYFDNYLVEFTRETIGIIDNTFISILTYPSIHPYIHICTHEQTALSTNMKTIITCIKIMLHRSKQANKQTKQYAREHNRRES